MPPNGIAEDSGGNTKYAEYTYLGAATVVQLKYPAVTDAGSNPLVLTYGTGGSYGGFDLPTWLAPARQAGRSAHGPAVLRGDRNSNRLYRKNEHPDATSFDELDPGNASSAAQGAQTENVCERFFWAAQDANYNVLGIVSATGLLVERYEYTPYGRRTVFSRNWLLADMTDDGFVDGADYNLLMDQWGTSKPASRADINGDGAVDGADQTGWSDSYGNSHPEFDALTTHPRLESARGRGSGPLLPLACSTCDVGHQGLLLDKEFDLYYNRARCLHPTVGRFPQRDPKAYADGMNLYDYVRSCPLTGVDPKGQDFIYPAKVPGLYMGLPREKWEPYVILGPAEHLSSVIEAIRKTGAFAATVWSEGTAVGILQFTEYEPLEREGYTEEHEPVLVRGGKLEGGFRATVNIKDWPHCCHDLRWIQIIETDFFGGTKKTIVDGTEKPFYYDTHRGLRYHKGFLVSRWYGEEVGNPVHKPYNLHFRDEPNTANKDRSFDAKLCLVCVRSYCLRRATALTCVKWGFHISADGQVQMIPRDIMLSMWTPDDQKVVAQYGWNVSR